MRGKGFCSKAHHAGPRLQIAHLFTNTCDCTRAFKTKHRAGQTSIQHVIIQKAHGHHHIAEIQTGGRHFHFNFMRAGRFAIRARPDELR